MEEANNGDADMGEDPAFYRACMMFRSALDEIAVTEAQCRGGSTTVELDEDVALMRTRCSLGYGLLRFRAEGLAVTEALEEPHRTFYMGGPDPSGGSCTQALGEIEGLMYWNLGERVGAPHVLEP